MGYCTYVFYVVDVVDQLRDDEVLIVLGLREYPSFIHHHVVKARL